MNRVSSTGQPRHAVVPTALEDRFAARVVAGLAEPVHQLPPDVVERLRFAREQAVERAVRHASLGAQPRSTSGDVLAGVGRWLRRLIPAVPAAALVVGMLLVGQANERERLLAAAEIDTALLADPVPPDAYADPGFVAFLELSPP